MVLTPNDYPLRFDHQVFEIKTYRRIIISSSRAQNCSKLNVDLHNINNFVTF